MEKPPEVPATLNQTGPASHSSVLHTPSSIMGPPPPIIERTTAQGILGPAPYPSLALAVFGYFRACFSRKESRLHRILNEVYL